MRGPGRVNLASRIDIDPRTAAGRALIDARRALLAELPKEHAGGYRVERLVDMIVRTGLYLDSLDAGLLASTTLLTNRRQVKPALEARERLLERFQGLLADLERLCASKPAPEPQDSRVEAILARYRKPAEPAERPA